MQPTLQDASSEWICETGSSLGILGCSTELDPSSKAEGERLFVCSELAGLWAGFSLPACHAHPGRCPRQMMTSRQGRNADREARFLPGSVPLRRHSLLRDTLSGRMGLPGFSARACLPAISQYLCGKGEHVGSASQGSENKRTLSCQPGRQRGRAQLGVPGAHSLEQRP